MDLAVTLLQDQLDEITANTRTLVQPERLAIGERAVEELLLSGAESRALKAGANAPFFELLDFTGKLVKSADLLSLGPLILSFSAAAGVRIALLNWKRGATCWARSATGEHCLWLSRRRLCATTISPLTGIR